MASTFDIPILLVTFNRPENTSVVLKEIKKIKPSKLYIFSDAPRAGNAKDVIDVSETRTLFNDTNFACEVFKLFEKKNLGCGPGVSKAINWIFESEEMAIILEDDCVPNSSFFHFCRLMLLKYKMDSKVMHISGTRWNPEYDVGDLDYFFSSISHIWGWATWKRAWNKYDYSMNTWNKESMKDQLIKMFRNRLLSQYLLQSFDEISKLSNKHTWDIQWQCTILRENGLVINPNVNLVSNIGIEGVHTKTADEYYYFRQTSDWVDRGTDLNSLIADRSFDRYHIKNHFMKAFVLKQKLRLYYDSYFN